MEEYRIKAALSGVVFFQEEIKSRSVLCLKDFAAQAGRSVKWVERKHAEGALYAYAMRPDFVEAVCVAFPQKRSELSLIADFVKQGQTLLYPAWQIRRKGVIRPEVAMAREAFNLYAKELFDVVEVEHKKNPAAWAAPKLTPSPDDNKLFFFFMEFGRYGQRIDCRSNRAPQGLQTQETPDGGKT